MGSQLVILMAVFTYNLSLISNVHQYNNLGPDSKDQHEIWNSVRKTMGLYENHIKFTYQYNPLPYHFFAIKIHQGFFYILEHAG